MSFSTDLHLDFCSYRAAKYAVERWHYSKRMPATKTFRIGVWEDGQFKGCLIFSAGSGAATDGRRFGLKQSFEVAELQRIALAKHKTEVSRLISISIRFCRKYLPGIKILVSYSDPAQGHHGGIYQAAGWIYSGLTPPDTQYRDEATGRIYHSRNVKKSGKQSNFGRITQSPDIASMTKIRLPGKHRYLYAVDKALRPKIESLSKPYPKRASRIPANRSVAD